MLFYKRRIEETDMRSIFSALSLYLFLSTISTASAQLPANPWNAATSPASVPQDILLETTVTPSYSNSDFDTNSNKKNILANSSAPTNYISSDGETLPVDPWSKEAKQAKVTSSDWIGSGNFGKLNYTGSATTYTEAQGQDMIAPEVNKHNMLAATQHLRNLGYKIPTGYDEKIKNMPKAYGAKLRDAYDSVFTYNTPLAQSF